MVFVYCLKFILFQFLKCKFTHAAAAKIVARYKAGMGAAEGGDKNRRGGEEDDVL
jgi:hypothetical protein